MKNVVTKRKQYLRPLTEVFPLPEEHLAGGIGAESHGEGDEQDIWGDSQAINTPLFLQNNRLKNNRIQSRKGIDYKKGSIWD